MAAAKLLAIGCAAYAVALSAFAPATICDAILNRASSGLLRLAEARGTLWSGSGLLELRDASRRHGMARRVAWRFTPAAVLRGKIAAEIDPEGWGRSFRLAASMSRVEITDLDVSLPAAAGGFVVPRLEPLELTGELYLRAQSLTFDRAVMNGEAVLLWAAAGSALVPGSALGAYELRIEGAADMRANLRTLDGPLEISGTGAWANGETPRLHVTARVPPEHQERLEPMLRLIAVQLHAGTFELTLQ